MHVDPIPSGSGREVKRNADEDDDAAVAHAVTQNENDDKASKKLRAEGRPLITHQQALAVICNFRSQERHVYNGTDDASLQNISGEPKDGGRFYQTACYEDGTPWGFDQREEPTEKKKRKNAKKYRLPDLFQKQHTRVLHKDLTER